MPRTPKTFSVSPCPASAGVTTPHRAAGAAVDRVTVLVVPETEGPGDLGAVDGAVPSSGSSIATPYGTASPQLKKPPSAGEVMPTVGAVLPTVICLLRQAGLALRVGDLQPGLELPVVGVGTGDGGTGRVEGAVAVEVPLIGERAVLRVGGRGGVEGHRQAGRARTTGSASITAVGALLPSA